MEHNVAGDISERFRGKRPSMAEIMEDSKKRLYVNTREGLFSVVDAHNNMTLVRVPVRTGTSVSVREGKHHQEDPDSHLRFAKGVAYRQVFKRAPHKHECVDDTVTEVSIVEVDLQKADVLMEFLP